MAIPAGLMDFVHRFQEIQAYRENSNNLITDILLYCQTLESSLREENRNLNIQIQDAQLDLVDATKSRRELQQRLHQLEVSNDTLSTENHLLKNNNPYVVVLIDGDGLLFQDAFIRQGLEGGKKAAYALRSAILKECGEHAAGVEVIARVYTHLGGLSRAMRLDGCIDHESDLKNFSLGFTQAKASFDWVDVGQGKERADNKIKEATNWNLRNHNCKQVILGISHDSGYAPFLDEIFQDEANRRRVTIMEGYPTTRELVATGVNILGNLTEALFRSEKLVTDRILYSIRNTSPPRTSPTAPTNNNSFGVIGGGPPPSSTSMPSLSSSLTSVASTVSVASTSAPSLAMSSPSPATSNVSTPATVPATTYARATATNASPPPQITLPIQLKPANTTRSSQQQQQAPPQPPWNPGPRGLDPPINVSQTALDSIKKRKDSNKLCNNHYLRGPCAKGDACCFEHRYKPSKEEINAIAFLTRLNPCANGQECDVEDCIYGHHCPSVQNGVCTHPYCKFGPLDHPPGTKFKRTHDH
ncbi:hypothetical protein QBC46DRAFT_337578 [Diplogelasinospora grovesii]|uniref:C3H1-type domain-containing protein n=1 Tax=Diplogelasinospora grovesii TaxID=303347 RepID=A0AAN6S8M3_9PEZI|nr:hypothetical protein QBC46DRAFT_337578 [Diplogelasinospora grovesii]